MEEPPPRVDQVDPLVGQALMQGLASKSRCPTRGASLLWQYAGYAVVIYSRAAAERLDVQLEELARRTAARHYLDLPNDRGPRDHHGEMAA